MARSEPKPEPGRSFTEDERAIEGLPIRLVIALVVGVAALGIMMQVLGTLGDFGAKTEVTVEYSDPVVDEGGSNVDISVVDAKGEEVKGSTVIVQGGTLNVENTYDEATGGSSNQVTGISINDQSSADVQTDFGTNQDTGTLTVIVVPPSDGNYVDNQGNPELTVINT